MATPPPTSAIPRSILTRWIAEYTAGVTQARDVGDEADIYANEEVLRVLLEIEREAGEQVTT